MIRIFHNANYDFQGKRRLAMSLSGLVILLSLVSIIMHGGPNYSIDFTGGLSITLRSEAPEGVASITEEQLRATLGKIGYASAEVKLSRSSEGEDMLLRLKEEGRYRPPESIIRTALEQKLAGRWRLVTDDLLEVKTLESLEGRSYVAVGADVPELTLKAMMDSVELDMPQVETVKSLEAEDVYILSGEGRDVSSKLRRLLAEDYPGYKFDIRSIDRVGPRIGSELRVQAVLAVLASLVLIMIYLWWRFELIFGVAAVIALFHDVMITLGLFSVLNMEISITVVGAFLTLVGYSLNDTIVVFDRIRENIKRYKDQPYHQVINTSINQTLSRTIITGVTTLMVILVLFIMGGEVLHSFSLCLLVGILVGTYSSIYIASPILIEWANRTGQVVGQKKTK